MAVTVPSVSKKSTMTIESSSGTNRMSNAVRRSAWNTVSKRGIRKNAPVGHCDTPSSNAAAVVLTMPITIAPDTFFESKNAMISRPASANRGAGACSDP